MALALVSAIVVAWAVVALARATLGVARRGIGSVRDALVVAATTGAALVATFYLDLASYLAFVLLPVAILPGAALVGMTSGLDAATDAEAWRVAGGIFAMALIISYFAAWLLVAWSAFCGACLLNALRLVSRSPKMR